MADLSLRDRIAAALRESAFLCDDCCDLPDEAACDAAHPIQPTVLHFDVVTDIAGPVDAIADAVTGVVQGEIDRLTKERDAALATLREVRRDLVLLYASLPGGLDFYLGRIRITRQRIDATLSGEAAPAVEPDAPTCGVGHPRKVSTCTNPERHDGDHRDAFGHTWPQRDGDKPLFRKET